MCLELYMIPMPVEHSTNRMPYTIRMSVEGLNCVTLRLSNTLFIYVLKLKQPWRPLLQNVEQRTNHTK